MKLLKDVNWSKSCDFGGRLTFVDKLDVRFALLRHIRLQVAHIPPLILLIVVSNTALQIDSIRCHTKLLFVVVVRAMRSLDFWMVLKKEFQWAWMMKAAMMALTPEGKQLDLCLVLTWWESMLL